MIENETPERQADRLQLQRIAAMLAKAVAGFLPPEVKVSFALVLFDVGAEGGMAYASNAERDGVIKALRELTEKMSIEGEAQAVVAGRSAS